MRKEFKWHELDTFSQRRKQRKIIEEIKGLAVYLKKETGFSKTRQTMENYMRFFGSLCHLPVILLMLDEEYITPTTEKDCQEKTIKFNVKWFMNNGVSLNQLVREKPGKHVQFLKSIDLPATLKKVLPLFEEDLVAEDVRLAYKSKESNKGNSSKNKKRKRDGNRALFFFFRTTSLLFCFSNFEVKFKIALLLYFSAFLLFSSDQKKKGFLVDFFLL